MCKVKIVNLLVKIETNISLYINYFNISLGVYNNMA